MAWRLAVTTLLLLLLARGVRLHARAERDKQQLPPLHSSPHTACAACEVVVGIVANAVQNPNVRLYEQPPVEEWEGGTLQQRAYVRSDKFVNSLLDMLCNSTTLAKILREQDVWGRSAYAHDPVPNYSAEPKVEAGLHQVCRVMTGGRHRTRLRRTVLKLVDRLQVPDIQVHICAQTFDACQWKATKWGWLHALVEDLASPVNALRLLPLVVILCSFPFLLLSSCGWRPAPSVFDRTDAPALKSNSPVPVTKKAV